MLGEGEFGVVLEVSKVNVKDECTCRLCCGRTNDSFFDTPVPVLSPTSPVLSSHLPPRSIVIGMQPAVQGCQHKQAEEEQGADEKTESTEDNCDAVSAFDELDIEDDCDLLSDMGLVRGRMSAHCLRNSIARFAVKHLREGVGVEIKADAVYDLACEAKYLASLTHPNIVKLRGTVGIPGSPGFMLILDRLTLTLEEKINQWRLDQRKFRGVLGIFRRDVAGLADVYMQRLVVLFDISRAMRYLHKKRILYRDIKADNIGFNVRGDVRIFDFGLAKELKAKDLVKKPDGYESTGLTGSRRYMAPEVVRCLPYGFSADVYSFGILAWQVVALQTPFADYDADMHFDRVVTKGRRPNRFALHVLPKLLERMVEDCWSADPSERPTFRQICIQIQSELLGMKEGKSSSSVIDRSTHLMDRSLRSLYERSEWKSFVPYQKVRP
jgi:serine/threonine protein kinase